MPTEIVEADLSYRIGGGFYRVYNTVGYGFVEPVYTRALVVALQRSGLKVEREVPITIQFEGVDVGQYRADLLVERRIIIEVKSTELVAPATHRQVRNYLAAFGLRLGLILHFGPTAKIHRILCPSRNHSHDSQNSSNSHA
jgi:GxxExxY protein